MWYIISEQAGIADNIICRLGIKEAMYVGNLESLSFLIYSSRISEQFIGEERSMKHRCNRFCFSVMKGFILSLIRDSNTLDMVRVVVNPR